MRSGARTTRCGGTALVGLTGWLYLAAGLGMLASAAVIPAHEELERAREIQTRAEAEVEHRKARRLDAGDRIAALAAPSDALLVSLAQTHLNLAPTGSRPLDLHERVPAPPAPRARLASGSVAAPPPPSSRLASLATGRTSRSAMIILGAVCILVGLLPPAQTPDRPTGA